MRKSDIPLEAAFMAVANPPSSCLRSQYKYFWTVRPLPKTQNNDLFISSKQKKAILEMALKSFILSKLDHQMSKS